MKKIIGLILISINIYAQPYLTQEMIYEGVGKGIVAGIEGVAGAGRYITNTQTEKEKCNHEWWVYFKKSTHIIALTETENREIKNLLQKNNIDYQIALNQRLNNITVDENNLKDQSCSQEYFEQLVKNEKKIKEVKTENQVLKELMNINRINNNKIIFNENTKRDRPTLNIEMTDSIEEAKKEVE